MNKMIDVAPGFQYSVNIGYDLNHDDKLKKLHPDEVVPSSPKGDSVEY